MNASFEKWLESDECYKLLLHCSEQVLRRAQHRSICLEIIFQDAVTDRKGDLKQLIAHEMWAFLKGKSDRIADSAYDMLVHADKSGFMELVIGMFLDHCKDKRRTISVDPAFAYYRSIRATLSKAEDVNFQATRQGSFYAFSFDSSLRQLPFMHWDQSYDDWPMPPHSVSEIYNSPIVIELARFFWSEALSRYDMPYLLPVKELFRFLGCKYPIYCTIESEEVAEGTVKSDESAPRNLYEIAIPKDHVGDVLGAYALQNPRIEIDVIETELEDLARDCLATFSETERIVISRLEAGVALAEIASELGMRHLSNVSYHKKKVHEKLRRSWSLWGLGETGIPDGSEEEEFWIFYDKVVELCKTAEHRRNS